MQRFQHLELRQEDGLATIQLERTAARNALSSDLLEELSEALGVVRSEPEVRVCRLAGAGVDFCAGFDLHHMSDRAMREGLTEQLVRDLANAGHRVIKQLRSLPSLTLASVQGHALGGGFLLAAACDFRVIATGARIALPEVDLGMPLIWGGVPLLLHELGPALGRDLMFSGRSLNESTNGFEGFATRTCAPGELEDVSAQFIDTLLSKPPHALKLLKRQCVMERPQAGASAAAEADLAVEAILHPEFLPHVMKAISIGTQSGGN